MSPLIVDQMNYDDGMSGGNTNQLEMTSIDPMKLQ